MNPSFWKNRKVLITGHTGFKGGWLSLWLHTRGTDVIGYALPPPTTPSLFEIADLSRRITSIEGDIRDLDHFQSVIIEHDPEIIIHMAAQPLVRRSYNDPVETFSTNIMGTLNVLEAVRQTENRVKVILVITSDKCYENREWLWGYRENDPMGGHDPYSCSKGCAELVTSSYRNSFFLKPDQTKNGVAIATARAGNVIGGGDWGKDRLIPDIMKAIADKRSIVIRYPNAVRPWQHVLEPLGGYLCLVEHLWENGTKYAGGWNFGPEDKDCQSVSWILNRLHDIWGDRVSWELDKADNPHEATYLKLDCSKAKNLLGWFPKLDLKRALDWVSEWYMTFLRKEDMYTLSLSQISKYEKESKL